MGKTAVVIGGGPAGLTAAYELLKQHSGYDVILLEQSGDLGGISRTVCHHGNRMDIGGHRFFSKDERVMRWWRDLMPVQGVNSFDDQRLGRKKPLSLEGADPEKEDRVMLIRDRVSRIYYLNKFFDYPISMKFSTLKNLGVKRTMTAGLSYMESALVKRTEDSLENFYINRFGKVLYGMFFEGYTQKVWGRHPSHISADWGAQRVKGLSVGALIKDIAVKALGRKKKDISQKKVETSLIEQFLYPKFGPGQLWETAAEEIRRMGGEIRMNCRVKDIECTHGSVRSVTYECEGVLTTLPADVVISSMPLKDLVEAITGMVVPVKVRSIAEGLPYRDFVTVGLLVNKLAIKNETNLPTLGNIVPDCWIYVQDTGVKLGRIQIFNNWSPYMLADAENTVWIGLEYFCDEGDEFWSMGEEDCIDFAVEELVRIGIVQKEDVLDAHRERVAKAYPAYFDTYSQIDQLVDYLNSFNNLYCVGRNGQHRYNNMDHSMLTAMYAVDTITGKNKDKNGIWSINAEKEYQEKK